MEQWILDVKGKGRPRTGHEKTEGELYLYSFFNLGAKRRWVANATPSAALTPGKKNGTHCRGGWVGPRASLDWCGKPHSHRIFLCVFFSFVLFFSSIVYLYIICPVTYSSTTHTTYPCTRAGFKPAIPAGDRQQTLALHRSLALGSALDSLPGPSSP